jgi:CarD family transcriptional regulator
VIFQQGDLAIFPTQGVVSVVEVERFEVGGLVGSLYALRCLDTDKIIQVPVANADQLGLRPLASQAEAASVRAALQSPAPPLEALPEEQRALQLVLKIQRGVLIGVAEVVRDLHAARQRRPLTQGERRIDELALRLLAQELAAVEGQEEDAVSAQIEALLG